MSKSRAPKNSKTKRSRPGAPGWLDFVSKRNRSEPKNAAIRVGANSRPIEPYQLEKTLTQGRPAQSGARNRLGFAFLLASLIGVVILVWWATDRNGESELASVESKSDVNERLEFQKRVEFYRRQTGLKLNRTRAGVEYQNQIEAPPLAPDVIRQPKKEYGRDLNLMSEAYLRENAKPDTSRPLDPDHPDARIFYGLQEEQDATEWERQAQERYIEEFIANAARAGYRVKVDRFGNVITDPVRRRPPPGPPSDDSAVETGARTPGSIH